jgi:ADP-L-glycero-D-manno-heptose 6-epimerase
MFNLNDKKILITGGAGFIGSNLAHSINNRFPSAKVTIFDKFQSDEHFPSGNPTALGCFKNLIGFNGNIIVGDINSYEDLKNIENQQWDIIFHQAAISDTTVLNQNLVLKTNSNSFRYFIDLSEKCNAKLIYASSAGTYGNSVPPNLVGEGEVPENVYGYSKLLMDEMTRAYLANNPKIEIIGLRYFNVYGNREFFKGKTSSMILQLGLQILKGQNPKLFKYGEQLRDFIYVNDVVQANLKAIDGPSGIYNVGSGVSRSFNDIISILKINLEIEFEIEYIDNPYKFYQNNTCANIEMTQKNLGFTPEFTLEEGIKAYIQEIKDVSLSNK